jgi:hypothetical protein
MAASPVISMAAAIAALNAVTALLNTGGAGHINIYSGSPPAGGTLVAASGTLLSSGCTLSATAFPTAVDGVTTGLATATANAVGTDNNCAATGTAGYYRALNGAGTVIIQGTVGTAAADMILNTVAIVQGSSVAITSWVITMPDGTSSD